MDSSQQVRAGITCLETGDWKASLRHFDRAIALRQASDWKNHTMEAWGLAAAWINRSDALRRLGDTCEAIRSLREAILAMARVPLAEQPAFPERLILAWMNLASASEEAGNNDSAAEAFSEASSLLETWGKEVSPTRTFLSAMFHTNRSGFLLRNGERVRAWEDARRAVRLLGGLSSDPEVISASIRARGALCRSLAFILEEPQGRDLESDWIAAATDAAEEALALARSIRFHDHWISGLVLYCAKIYRICQPHFLAEFILESFPSGSPLRDDGVLVERIAKECLLARAELELRVRKRPHDTHSVRREIGILRSIQFAEEQISTRAPRSSSES